MQTIDWIVLGLIIWIALIVTILVFFAGAKRRSGDDDNE